MPGAQCAGFGKRAHPSVTRTYSRAHTTATRTIIASDKATKTTRGR